MVQAIAKPRRSPKQMQAHQYFTRKVGLSSGRVVRRS